jgi:hypothetical protein
MNLAMRLIASWERWRAKTAGKEMMGKTADNEKLKIEATFANNLGVGLILAGVFLPVFKILGTVGQLPKSPGDLLTFDNFCLVIACVAALCAGGYFHHLALKTISRIQD